MVSCSKVLRGLNNNPTFQPDRDYDPDLFEDAYPINYGECLLSILTITHYLLNRVGAQKSAILMRGCKTSIRSFQKSLVKMHEVLEKLCDT